MRFNLTKRRPNAVKPPQGTSLAIDPSHPLAKGLVLLTFFNEQGGNTVKDMSATSTDATLTNGSVNLQWGRMNDRAYCVFTDSANLVDWGTGFTNSYIDGATALSMSTRVSMHSFADGAFMGASNVAGTQQVFFGPNFNTIQWTIQTSGATFQGTSPVPIPSNSQAEDLAWSQSFRYDGTATGNARLRGSVNGAEVSLTYSGSSVSVLPTVNHQFRLGENLLGSIDRNLWEYVAVWNWAVPMELLQEFEVNPYDILAPRGQPFFFIPVITTVVVDSSAVMNDGGYVLNLSGTGLSGTFRVHLGALGTIADPICYSGVSGKDGRITFTAGAAQIYTPPLPVGGPYIFTFEDLINPNNVVLPSSAVITVTPHDFRSGTLSIRSIFAPNWRTGYRSLSSETYPQP